MGIHCTLGCEAELAFVKQANQYCLAGKRPIQAFLCSLPWWLKVDRRFDSPIYLFGCEENFRLRSHCPG
jgi:hypothetical protein